MFYQEEVLEEFSNIQTLNGVEQLYLSDETDMQEYISNILLTKPQFNMTEGHDPTCLCTKTSKRRWKNQHAEGTYIHVATFLATQWSDQDLEEMAYQPLPPTADMAQDFIRSYEQQNPEPAAEEIPKEIPELSNDDYLDSHTRVQISMKQKSTNVKGRYYNFEIPNVPIQEIFNCCNTLLTIFPKLPRKQIRFYTRVQLQNKINGKMQGGANLSVHNATPEEVNNLLFEMFDGSGWLPPKARSVPKNAGAAEKGVSVGNNKGKMRDRRSQSEDGPPKAGNTCVPGEGGGGLSHHPSKIQKDRISLLEAATGIRARA